MQDIWANFAFWFGSRCLYIRDCSIGKFLGLNLAILSLFCIVMASSKPPTPLHTGQFTPQICTDLSGVKNPREIGGNPPIGRKEQMRCYIVKHYFLRKMSINHRGYDCPRNLFMFSNMGTGRCLKISHCLADQVARWAGHPLKNVLKMYIYNFHGFYWFNFDK